MSNIEPIRCLILGSGPAGLTAAIYAARANLEPVLYQGFVPGGQLIITTDVENYPGYPEAITGPELMAKIEQQAKRFGTDIRHGVATSVDFSERPFKITINNTDEVLADSVIIATGATAKFLKLPSERHFMGMGVSACATCDGFFYRGKDVAVIGGGDTACEEAVYLAGICNKVYMIVRKKYLRASKISQHIVEGTENIEIIFEHNVKEVLGDDEGVNGLLLIGNDGAEWQLAVSGMFLAIGHHPNTEIFKDYLTLDESGYIVTIPGSAQTNVEGIFAAGDVQDNQYKQAVIAAGSGCIAAISCEKFLSEMHAKAQ